MRSTAPANAQPLEKLEAEYEEPPSHQHASQMREPPEAGPSNYFTASRPSSSSSASTTTSHAHYFPSPSTPESPFSASSLASAFPQSHLHPSDASDPAAPRAISADQLHLNVIWHHINLPKEERDQHVATATWRRWQRLSPATKRYLSRQMHQQVLRGVVPSVDHMRPYIEAVRRQSEPAPEDARFGKQKEKQKAGESRGREGSSLNTLPDIGHRFRSVLEEMDNLAVLKPASHAPGSSPWDYRFTLLYLARIGDSPSAEKIADTMRHRGVPLNIRHVDARLVALVRYLEKSRHRKRSMSGQEVDAVVETLWKILGDMNTHMERDSAKLGGAAKRPREITMMMLLQVINLARRIFARAANAAAASTDSATSSSAASAASSAATSSPRTATATASATAPLLPLGNPSSPTSDKALELDRLLEEVLLKGYNLDLRHATYKTPLYDAQGQEVKRARMNGVVLLAMVDHFGRQGEVWKMISVLHAYGETKAWDGLAGVMEQAETGKRDGGAEVLEEEAVGLEEMMRREAEGRKGMDMFGRIKASSAVSVESSTAVEGTAETLASAEGGPVSAVATLATASRISAPSTRLFDTFYPSMPVSTTSTASADTVAPLVAENDVNCNIDIDTSYDASFQRTDIYTTALQHALRKDDWAVSLHVLSTAITASREVRAQWLAARWARERRRAALYQGATTTAQEASAIPAAADSAAHTDINAQLPAIPYPRISVHPEWFLRTHIRMTRYRAGAKHFAKLQDLMRRAMGDVRDEARALASMEGWSGNVSRTADADADAEAEAGAEAGMSHVDGYEYWARDMAELERLDEVVMGRSKEGAEVWKVVQAQAQAEGEEEGEGLEGREVSPDIPSPAFTATTPIDPTAPQMTPDATSSTPASPTIASTQTPQPPHTHPSAPPSHHLLSTLGTHASLRSILAYSLHRKTLAHGVRARSNLRFEANQMVRKEKREEEERERAEKRERGRAGARRKGKKQEQGTVEGVMGEGGGRIVGSDGTMAAMA